MFGFLRVERHYQIGDSLAVVQPGYTKVGTSAYSSARGYGWTGTAPTIVGLTTDNWRNPADVAENLVYTAAAMTFQVDLPNGVYFVGIGACDDVSDHGQTVTVQGNLVDTILGGQGGGVALNSVQPYTNTYVATVSNGHLTILITAQTSPTAYTAILNLIDIVKQTPGARSIRGAGAIQSGAPVGQMFVGPYYALVDPAGFDLTTSGGRSSWHAALAAGLGSSNDATLVNGAHTVLYECAQTHAQGIILWDISLDNIAPASLIKYVGDPRIAPQGWDVTTPGDAAYTDTFFGILKAAGLRIGCTLRPQVATIVNSTQAVQRDSATLNELLNNLCAKVQYALTRWGMDLFYVDSNDWGPSGFLIPGATWNELVARFPGCHFFPEHNVNGNTSTRSLPVWDARNDFGRTGREATTIATATVTASGSNPTTVTATSGVFTAAMVGDVIDDGTIPYGGRPTIGIYVSPTQVKLDNPWAPNWSSTSVSIKYPALPSYTSWIINITTDTGREAQYTSAIGVGSNLAFQPNDPVVAICKSCYGF